MSIKDELQEEEGRIQTITDLLSLYAIATTASEYFVKSEAKCIEVRLSHNSVDIRACVYFSFFFFFDIFFRWFATLHPARKVNKYR